MSSHRSQLSRCFSLPLLVALSTLMARASSQCSLQWLPGHAIPGTDGWVGATTLWDHDGPGPRPPVLVVAGAFTAAGTVNAQKIAACDPVSGAWSALGSGMSDASGGGARVHALTTLPNGDLVAGGTFTNAGGVSANCIARWDGTSWSPVGSGMASSSGAQVYALTTLPNGDLVAGGSFTIAGGVIANCIARWNGTSWSPLGSGMNGAVRDLTTLSNGDLVAGGSFTLAGGVSANGIARWDGARWSALGTGLTGAASQVMALTTLPNGDLVAGGHFTQAGAVTAKSIARWDGRRWSALGSGLSEAWIFSLTTLSNGVLVAGGNFTTAGGVSASGIARWDGTSWSALGSGLSGNVMWPVSQVSTLTALPNGELVAGGSFLTAGLVNASNIARFDGAQWSALGSGTNGTVRAFARLPNGDLVAGGAFTSLAGVRAKGIARWDGTTWSPLGSGIDGRVYALTTLSNGDLVAGGYFTTAGGVTANSIARWDGTTWWPLGSGLMNGEVSALTTLPNGHLVAGGFFWDAGGVFAFNIARWDGFTWSSMGHMVGGVTAGWVNALTTLPNGDLVAGGDFDSAGGVSANHIARWDGATWWPLGSGMSWPVTSLTTLANGDLVAGGYFGVAGGVSATCIARWDGTNWSALGSGMGAFVTALTTLPNGDIVAGGFDFGGVSATRIARWDGTSWSTLGSCEGDSGGGGYSLFAGHSQVRCLTVRPRGSLLAGGEFTVVNGAVSANLAELASTCPAGAGSYGAGCTGTAGPVVLSVTSLPWIGGTFRGSTTGLSTNSFAFELFSSNPISMPLSSVHPLGVPGCTVHVAPDILQVLVGAGTVQSQLAIPNLAALIGVTFRHQVVPVELDALGNITALTSSNALLLTIGSF